MDLVAPLGPVYQAGTLSGNPLAMAAGLATLRYLRDHKGMIYRQLDKTSGILASGVAAAAKDAGVPMCFNRVGSMFTWFFTAGPAKRLYSASHSGIVAICRVFCAPLGIRREPTPLRLGIPAL